MRLAPVVLSVVCVSSAVMTASAQYGSNPDGGFSGSGTFVTTSNGNGSFTINSVTSSAGAGVDTLLPVNSFQNNISLYNDNLLFPSNAAVLDSNGFAFTDSQGDTGFTVDVYANPGGDASGEYPYTAYFSDSDGVTGAVPVSFTLTSDSPAPQSAHAALFLAQAAPTYPPAGTVEDFSFTFAPAAVAPTPEPSSLVLLGTGLLAACGAARRRFRA